MRRSLDFGTLAGSLSTLKSSNSNGNGHHGNGVSSSSPAGSRFGTIAGMPSSESGSANNNSDTFIRPKSALSSGGGRGGGRRAFALASLFSVGHANGNGHTESNTRQDTLHPSQSATDVHESSTSSSTPPHPPSPDTPAEREHALMRAVQAAKAKDQAWEITIQPAPSEGLFLEYGNSRKDRGGSKASREGSTGTGTGNGAAATANQMFGRARRFLGGGGRRTGDKASSTMTNSNSTLLSPTSEVDEFDNIASSTTATDDASMAASSISPTTPEGRHTKTVSRAAQDGNGLHTSVPTSPAKRPLETSEDDEPLNINVKAASNTASRTVEGPNASTSTPASNDIAILPTPSTATAHPDQLLILYVTTGSSSLTLYRKIGQLVKLDDELRKHFTAHLPNTARPSILSLPSSSRVLATSPTQGHTRRKSVLASITRTFTSPTITRRASPNLLSSASQASIAEESGPLETPSSRYTSSLTTAGKTSASVPMEDRQPLSSAMVSPQYPILQSQLSNLSDYLASLSCVAVIRASKQWTSFFKPGREDHESARLEPVLPAPSQGGNTLSKGRRLKRMKSDTGVETRPSHMSSPPPSLPRDGLDKVNSLGLVETPERKEVRIDDSGIGVDSLGRHSSPGPSGGRGQDQTHLGRGHPTESFTNSSSAISNAASSMNMKREVSNGTNTSISAMSLFIEHTEENTEKVGDPEVLAYMERLRQDSEARHASSSAANHDPFNSTSIPLKSRKEPKSSKSTVMEYIMPPTPTSPTHGEELQATSSAVETLEPVQTMPLVTSPSEEPILAALEDSLDVENGLDDAEEASLPPLSGATVVATEEEQTDQPPAPQEVNLSQELQNGGYLSPESALSDEAGALSPLSPLLGKKKQSASSLRRRRKSSAANASLSVRTRSHKPSIRIEDFEILRVLGKGCAGKVLLARVKDMTTVSSTGGGDNALYAIKAIHKHHVLAHRELAHTLTEQSILRKMATDTPNPFVVRMRWSFQDQDNLFLVLDFHPGGDLATQLSRWGRLGKDRTRFYAAEIIEGLESLHRAGVIYRDLKPENILLAADGHIVLTDFGLSKQFYRAPANGADGGENSAVVPHWLAKAGKKHNSRQSTSSIGKNAEITTTFCGTAEYLAPEVLLGHAYSYPVDMWSLGTMIYEMLLGVTPFYNEDHGVMYRRVLHEQLDFGPSEYLDSDTRALLRGLLQKEPEFRMTTSRVKRAKYFEAIDWQFVVNKRYIPPFIPNLSPDDPADTQNFEECFLTMDLGFVDEKDTEEIEIKAKTSGKEPDKAFDEDGRDVFADYSFDGAWANPDSDDEVGSDEAESGPDSSEDGSSDIEEEVVDVSSVAHLANGQSMLNTPEGDRLTVTQDEAVASASHDADSGVVESNPSDSPATPESHPSLLSQAMNGAPPRLVFQDSEVLPMVAEAQEDEPTNDNTTSAHIVPTTNVNLDPRGSIEMPRMSSPAAMSDEGAPRISAEHEDWDVVEALGSDEVASNGNLGPRKRLLAGTNLFAKGVVDRYKMQLKPSSRVPTPTRSYTARSPITRLASSSVQPTRSNKTSNQLSPSPSIGGMSETPSSVESSEQASRGEKKASKGPGRRLVTPRLLRASSEWMSSSLPSSPTPRFRMRRNKKGTAPEAMTPPATEGQPPSSVEMGFMPATPNSVESCATLPVENAGGFGLQPLSRQISRERYLPLSNARSGLTPSPDAAARRGPKLRKYVVDNKDKN